MRTNIFELLNIPTIDESKNYWFVRSYKGKYYEDFTLHDYIAISWDYISNDMLMTQSDVVIKKMIQDTMAYSEISLADEDQDLEDHVIGQKAQITATYNKLIRFSKEMAIGDIVLVPSRNSDYVSIGIIKSDVYTDPDYAASRYKKDIESTMAYCPFHKRRRIQWIKQFSRSNLDIYLQRAFNSQHALSKMNDYAPYIDRAIYPVYIKNGMVHATIHAEHPDGLTLRQLRKMTNCLCEAIDDITIQCNMPVDENISIKLNIHSPGIIEIASIALGAGIAVAIVINAINHYVNGGKISFGFKCNKCNGLEFSLMSETVGTRGHDYQEKTLDFKHAEELATVANELGFRIDELNEDRENNK